MKCPFCAEEIKDGAVFCRFCRKKLRASYLWRIVRQAFLLTVLLFYMNNWRAISDFIVRLSGNMARIWGVSNEIIKNMSHSVETMDKNKRDDLIKQYIDE